ncbi:AGAP000539-PA-like protein [Anopheles sinensis]|uniref:AGAP000539-PA-like protein n=1 Tax=Anopheles sinensis TaxID=74873 RepID=A0A084VX28_ANOSI|nr:AGAP000539-PA-like protein [Anopheles sinensis]
MDWGDRLVLIMFLGVFLRQGGALAVSGIYVNNQKIDKFEADRIKLLHPARPSSSINQTPSSSVGKDELLTKDNFTNAQHYYQYLVGANPASYIDLLWGRNKTHFPSLLRVGAPSLGFNWHSDDEQSSIKNTLNNSSPVYIGDYQHVQLPVLLPSTSTRAPSSRPTRRFKKRPKPKPTPEPQRVQVSPGGKNELSPETLALLSRYYSFSCTLVPKQRSQLVVTTTMPPTTTRKLKTRRLTTQRPITAMTTSRPTTSSSTGKRKKTTVYVDPPVINRIGGMLESVYNFMENALTSTEYVPDSKETGAAGVSKADPQEHLRSVPTSSTKVKRNTRNITSAISDILARIGDSSGGSTELDSDTRITSQWLSTTTESSSESSKRFTPDRVTISGLPTIVSEGNKNKMTTNIQVTSEYTAATPPTVPVRKPSSSSDENDEDSSEEESEEDYFGGFDGFSEDDEEEDDDEDDDDQSKDDDSEELGRPGGQGVLVNDKDYDEDDDGEDGTQAGQPVRIKRVKKRRRKKRPASSYEDTAEYSDEDDGSSDEEGEYDDRDAPSGDDDEEDDDDYESGEAPDDAAEGFFGGLFSTFGRFVRSLGFGGAARGTPEEYDDYDEGGGRSTTPRVLDTKRRPTRSTSNGVDGPATQIERDPDVTSPERSPPSWLNLPPSYLFNEIGDDPIEVPVQEELTVLEAPVPPTPETPTSVDTSSSWFDLMMPWDFFNPWTHDDAENAVQEAILTTEAPLTLAAPTQPPEVETSTPTSAPAAGSNWLSQFFVGSPTTTKPPKPRPKPPKAPQAEQLVAALAQYLVAARPTPQSTPKPRRKKSYAGYQLWRVSVQSSEHLQRLVDFQRSPEGLQLQWWSGPSLYEPTDVLVPPGAVAENFHDYLSEDGIQYEPTIRDLGRAIAYENPRMTRREQIENEVLHGHPMTWFRYHRYADIVKYLDYLGRRHSQQVRLLHIGRSYEGRPLTVVRVSLPPPARRSARSATKKRRPAVFIEAGAHGHQWVGPAVATWLLQRLLEPSNSTAEQETIRSYDWYVLPVANPDGYEYSHEHDRMWSKSRSRPDHRPQPGFGQTLLSSALSWWSNAQTTASRDRSSETCYGVDLDHNWAHRWQDTPESSRSECSATYAGPAAFSEPETRAVRDLLLTGRARNVRIFLSLQAYGQTLSYPNDGDDTSTRHGAYAFGDVHEMAAVGLEAMRGAGGELPYTLERPGSANRGPERGGTSTGYARYAAGIRYSYTLRLPDTGTHGFLFPPSNIVSTGRDTFELIKGMMDYS